MKYSLNPMSVVEERIVIAMVGLPARGKSYISKALIRYLQFLGCPAQLFNAGNKRRDQGKAGADANFFDAGNVRAKAQREEIAMETLGELIEWLGAVREHGCAVGIFDATNTTVARRETVVARCRCSSPPVRLIFLESICDDNEVLESNYRMKLSNDDYNGTDAEKAYNDFKQRVRAYEAVYERLTDAEAARYTPPLRYVKTIDAGRKLVCSSCDGFLMSYLLPLLQSIHLGQRKVSLVLAGQSENDRKGIRGGDTTLSDAGREYAQAVASLISSRPRTSSAGEPLVLTGTLRRYSQMCELLVRAMGEAKPQALAMRALNELNFGSLEGLPGGRLRESFPQEYAARALDKLHYRYPGSGGESYMDMIMQASPTS